MSSFEDAPSQFDAAGAGVLPNMIDQSTKKQNLAVIVSHVLRNNFKFFEDNLRLIQHDILHIHSKEMSLKSTVVSIMLLAYCS